MPTQRPLAIRPATGKDLAGLQALARRTIDASYRAFLGAEAVDWFIGSGASDAHVETQLDRGEVYCLTQDGETVGFCILDGPTIDLMMIDPRLHRRGLGRRLLQHAEALLFDHHPDIRLESFADNTSANSFYEACGWSPAGRMDAEGPAKVEYAKSHLATGRATTH